MAKKKTDLQKAAEEQATVALSKISVIKNKKRGDKKKEIKVVKPTTPEAPKKRRGRPTISGGEEKQEKRCTLYMTTELYQKIESVARIKKMSVNQFFLSLAKDEIEKPENKKIMEILKAVSEESM